MSLYDVPVRSITGEAGSFGDYAGKSVLVVNVASQCGETFQYAGLERLQEKYADRGFTVVGVPSNQFGGQEPGTSEEIVEFCSTTYGVSFPLLEKTDVNGEDRHPLYAELTKSAYADGSAARDIKWNFEKFLISPTGEVLARFKHRTEPEDATVIDAIEASLPA
jgi:glutathione peroxidase